ncbi:hypothetical protein ACFP1I_21930 [Dyadobacter subterraneus]|uniref:Uncharacterized protein n=1 Tax=Dyadobacter subterraneus TaxID=2773304 RepID=A0ABR9W6I0_9BACT|nr:hypothetical protein [Dyadobacter subterraneus]MBE9460576.1 hypothetical protein [Dyadobacter subterraneus]
MFVVGFVQPDHPKVLVFSNICKNETQLYRSIVSALEELNITLELPITLESIQNFSSEKKPCFIETKNSIKIVFAEKSVLEQAIYTYIS